MPKNTQPKIKDRQLRKTETKKTIWEIFRFDESYTSLILGIVAVIIVTITLLTFVKSKNLSTRPTRQEIKQIAAQTQEKVKNSPTPTISKPTPTQTQKLPKNEQKNVYIVAAGDSLWSIAEKKYKNGFNWVDIQKVNNLSNPNLLFVGTKLTIPNIDAEIGSVAKTNNVNQKVISAIQTNKIVGSNYIVVRGDTLWDVAVRAYGDGYAWIKIAKVNNLSNPNIIHSGNKLNIPRG